MTTAQRKFARAVADTMVDLEGDVPLARLHVWVGSFDTVADAAAWLLANSVTPDVI